MRSPQGLRLSDQPRQSEVGPPGPVKTADIAADGRVEIAQSDRDKMRQYAGRNPTPPAAVPDLKAIDLRVKVQAPASGRCARRPRMQVLRNWQSNRIALDLVVVRKAVEQFAANQQQLAAKDGEITQSIAALRATERDWSLPAPKVEPPNIRRCP
jgi:hypothetical protein